MIVSEQLWLNPEINRFAEERLFSAGITTFFRKSEPLLERCNQATLPGVSFWRLQHVAQDKANQPKVDGFMVWSITLTSRSLWWIDRALWPSCTTKKASNQSSELLNALPASQRAISREFSVSFKELVSSYTAGKSNFEDLILEVRCESCFASMFEEAQQQLGASSQILEMLADEFPIYYQSFVKEKNLEF